MKIEVVSDNKITFDRVRRGQCFRIDYEGSAPVYAIRTEDIVDDKMGDLYNAVDLEDGEFFRICDHEKVTLYPDARLIL